MRQIGDAEIGDGVRRNGDAESGDGDPNGMELRKAGRLGSMEKTEKRKRNGVGFGYATKLR